MKICVENRLIESIDRIEIIELGPVGFLRCFWYILRLMCC